MERISKSPRLYGLDSWRAALLIMGIATHSVTAPAGAYQWVTVATHAFRMEAFFCVSGFLAAGAIQRQAPSIWLRARLVTLGIPMLFAMFLLNPATIVLDIFTTELRTGTAIKHIEHLRPFFLHVWFLWVLILCSISIAIMPIISTNDRIRLSLIEQILSSPKLSRFCNLAAMVGLYVLLLVAAVIEQQLRSLGHAFGPGTIAHKIVTASVESGTITFPSYLLFFVAGFWLARVDSLRVAVFDAWPLQAALVAIGTFWIVSNYATYGHNIFPHFYPTDDSHPVYVWLPKLLVGLPAALLIVRHGVIAQRAPHVFKRLSEASYTIFVCHFILIRILVFIIGGAWWGSMTHYLAVVSLTTLCGYMIHCLIVEKSALAALILNGRVYRGPTGATSIRTFSSLFVRRHRTQ